MPIAAGLFRASLAVRERERPSLSQQKISTSRPSTAYPDLQSDTRIATSRGLGGNISSETNRDLPGCNPHSTRVALSVLELILGPFRPPAALYKAPKTTSALARPNFGSPPLQEPRLTSTANITMQFFGGVWRWQRVEFIGSNTPQSPLISPSVVSKLVSPLTVR